MKNNSSKIGFGLVVRLLLGVGTVKLCLACLFLFSSWITPLSDTGAVFAESASDQPPAAATPSGVSKDKTVSPSCNPEVLEIIRAEARQWDDKKRLLDSREKDLDMLKAEIEKRLDELKMLQTRLEEPLKKAKASYDNRFQHLVGVYSSMDPARAASLLDQLDEATVAKIFEAMKSKKVARILALMNSEKAAKISNILSRWKMAE